MKIEVIARKTADGKTQSLTAHSANVAQVSTSNSQYPKISMLVAYLHDLGKLSEEFQDYIRSGGERGSVIHAWQGAFFANDIFTDNDLASILLKEVISFCITAHHNYLSDGVSPDGTTGFYDKLTNIDAEKYHYNEIKSKISKDETKKLIELFDEAKSEISGMVERVRKVYTNKNSSNFALGLFLKYIYSCLIDADRFDAYLFNMGEKYETHQVNWDFLIETFEKGISGFSADTPINKIRKSISDKCLHASNKPTAIYHFTVPTGGGKTLSSLRFALNHCKKYNKKRIIYIIPYLSIIEQTAASIRAILDLPEENDIVLEHHSNIVQAEDESANELRKLSSSRWSAPIIITTMVQFLETVMSARAGKLRKFHSMADAVLIFDEIQSLPTKTIHCFNETITFLSKIHNSTIVLCSATQPTLEDTQRKNLSLAEKPELIDCLDDFKDIKRVMVKALPNKNTESTAQFIVNKANEHGNCLVIVNTKKAALTLFNHLIESNLDHKVLHLSTSMCPAHRKDIINQIKKGLKNNERIICVSTQLIEAGVDISFSCVVRSMAGLDSIAQAAGRCNRHGESSIPKSVYTFQLDDENLEKLPDIDSGRLVATEIIAGIPVTTDLLDKSVMDKYYREYFNNKEIQMDYPTSLDISIYTMLSNGDNARIRYKNLTGQQFNHVFFHSFYSADNNFSVIDNSTKSVVVLYKEAQNLVSRYKNLPKEVVTREKLSILRRLQQYSVGLYDYQIKLLMEQRALTMLDAESGVLCLNEIHYSANTGVVLEIVQDSLII